MFKNFLIKKMLQSQLKQVPPEMRDKIAAAMEKKPELFTKIAEEIQAEMKKGRDQMNSAMTVMGKYKAELQDLMK